MPDGIAELDVAAFLASELEELTFPSGNVRATKPTAKLKAPSDPLVFVYGSTGEDEEEWKDGGSGTGLTKPIVVIRGRARQNDAPELRRLMNRILDVLRFKELPGYCFGKATSVFDLGLSADRDTEMSINYRAHREVLPRPQHWGPDSPGAKTQVELEALVGSQTVDLRFRTFTVTVAAGEAIHVAFPADRGTPVFRIKKANATAFTAGGFALVDGALPFTTPLGADTYQHWEATGLPAGATTVEVR